MTLAQRIGRRMAQALEDSGMSAKDLMKEMGYTGRATWHRWVKGLSQPTYHDVAEIGRITGKPFAWFYRVDEESEDQAAFIVDLLATVLWRLLNGEALADALANELGDPAVVSPAVRRLLDEMAEAAREELVALTDGWLGLPPAERRQRLRRVVNSYLDPDAV